jgi:hypothetical protein
VSAAGEVSVGRGIDAERGVEAAEGRVGAIADQDRPQSVRVFRVVICPACRWQYGAWWLGCTVWEYWGDCPRCGGKTEVGTSFLPELRGAASVPAQQELGL